MSWSAAQYTLFEDERTRPVRDLVAAIPGEARRAIDLGCGPGNSTEVLMDRFPEAGIAGLDSSPDMIAAARKRLPRVAFAVADIASWSNTTTYDVILSNATLHWLPDHASLLPRLVSHLAEGGRLAIQMPDNLEEPSHRLMRDIAAEEPFRETLAEAGGDRTTVGRPHWYFDVLKPHCRRIDIWRTTYHHVLKDGAGGIVEWFKGSGLRPYLGRLDEEKQATFLERYRAATAQAYPAMQDGSVLLPFPRLFIVATRG